VGIKEGQAAAPQDGVLRWTDEYSGLSGPKVQRDTCLYILDILSYIRQSNRNRKWALTQSLLWNANGTKENSSTKDLTHGTKRAIESSLHFLIAQICSLAL